MTAGTEPSPGGGAADPTRTRGKDPAEVHPLARTKAEWRSVLASFGERPFRADQVFRWIHARGIFEPEAMTDLSVSLRQRLSESGFAAPGRVVHVHRSSDGTRKLVLEMTSAARVECVLIPMTKQAEVLDADLTAACDDDEAESTRQRVTLCISTQHGCAMGCVFCASGVAGLIRGLGAAEIVYQVLEARKHLEPDEDLRNLVFMGMGEPLHHYDETARAIQLLTDPGGAGMSPRRITVSTVGLVPGIRRLGQDFGGKVGLAVSLHAPDDETRERIIPMNRTFPVAKLIEALSEYPLPARRRITIEYTLIDGINDSLAHARRLVRLLKGLRVKVNLIPMNSISNSPLRAPKPGTVTAFREYLADAGLSCFVRTRRGDDVSAACGQLALQGSNLVRLGAAPRHKG